MQICYAQGFCDNVTEKWGILLYDKATKEKEVTHMSTFHITTENFEKEVLGSDRPVLVDFWASWCGPCRMVIPIVEELAREYPEYKVGKVNVDEEAELASRFGIMSIPTLLVFRDGKLAQQAVGARSKEELLAMLEE